LVVRRERSTREKIVKKKIPKEGGGEKKSS